MRRLLLSAFVWLHFAATLHAHRERLQQILGVIDLRTGESAQVFAGDSNKVYDFLAKGRPFFLATESKQMRASLVQFAQSKGIINGQITRSLFAQYMELMKAKRPPSIEFMSTTDLPALVGEGKNYKIFAVRWSVLTGI